MKRLCIIFILMVIGCKDKSTSVKIEKFIPGVYVRQYKDEYTKSFDTLEIRKVTQSGGYRYSVIKKTTYKRLNIREFPTNNAKLKEWVGYFEEGTNSLLLEPGGKRVHFEPELMEAIMGAHPYKKINN